MRVFILVFLLLCVLLISHVHAEVAENDPIGLVKALIGSATKISSNAEQEVVVGMLILLQDTIRTGKNSIVDVTMLDGAFFSIGPDTGFSFTVFRYNPVSLQGEMRTKLTKGKLIAEAGRIAQHSPSGAMVVSLPTLETILTGTRIGLSAGEK
jgi:hypothetical protein